MFNQKKLASFVIAGSMAFTMFFSSVPVNAQLTTPIEAAVQSVVDDGVLDVNKTPKQINVHMGDNPSTQVNFTYTTIAGSFTQVTINKVGDGAKVVVEGDDNIGQANKYFHKIAVSGLSPNTNYEYTIGYGENTKSGKFKTAPAAGSKDSFKFAYLADTQVSNAENAKALGATLAEVNAIDDLSFVYLAGDVTDSATNELQWEWLFNNSGAYPNGGQDMFANNLVSVIQGNHDNNTLNRHINAPGQEGNIVYSFDYGPATFIMLNLETARSDASARAKQKEFLIKAVASAKERGQWTIVGFHKSLYTGASHIVDSDVIEARTYWGPTFSELDVDLVLQGHDHVYTRGFVTAQGANAHAVVDTDGKIINPENAPLYMVGGHAGGLKWYSKINYAVTPGDPLTSGYSFLDKNSTDDNSDIKQEQVITEIEVSNTEFAIKTYMFKYNTSTDTITTDKYLYDELTVKREVEEKPEKNLSITTDANLVKKGQYFNVSTGFETPVKSNTAILRFSYDLDKFEYRGFTPAKGVTILKDEVADDMLKLTVMVADYNTKDYGKVLFSAKENVNLKNEDNAISVNVTYVLKAQDDTKTIASANASTTFTTYGDIPGDIDGDGKVSLIDLSSIIDAFGIDNTSPLWSKYKFYDSNNNGRIDIEDVRDIAKLVV